MAVQLTPVAALGPLLPEVADLDGAQAADALGRVRSIRGFLDAYEAQLTSKIRELSATGECAPAADLHTRDGGVSSKEARRKERRAELLDAAPAMAARLADGQITTAHADALADATTRIDDHTRRDFLDHHHDLAADAARMTPEEFARSCRDLVRLLERDHGIERDQQRRRDTRLTTTVDREGMYVLRARLHPELGTAVFHAINTETAKLMTASTGDDRDRSQVAADALAHLVTGGHQAVRPHEAEIRLHLDVRILLDDDHHDGVCEYHDGTPVPPPTARRLACNGRIVPLIIDTNGVVLNAGREQRLANRHQRRALRAMYLGCAFHGCDVLFDRCEIHHLDPFELGGRTDLDQLVPLCSRHHHVVHDHGFVLDLDAERTLTIRQRDGTVHATVPLRPSSSRIGSGAGPPGEPAPNGTRDTVGPPQQLDLIA